MLSYMVLIVRVLLDEPEYSYINLNTRGGSWTISKEKIAG